MRAMNSQLEIPRMWRDLDMHQWHGPILILGAADSGKSTLARYLYERLLSNQNTVGFLDADVGQNALEPPTTIAVALNKPSQSSTFPPTGLRRVCFVGHNTPCGHTEALLIGLYRLLLFTLQEHVASLVVDTSGFVNADYGAAELKWAQVALFRPCTVVAIQQADELTPIISPLRHLPGVRLIELPICEAVRARSREARRAYRASRYRAYFQKARRVPLPYQQLAVFPKPLFTPGQIAAIENANGFALALATVEQANESVVWLKTPWSGRGKVASLHLGKLRIDPETFEDKLNTAD
jgi:polynucleotide 5'-hydroxyl-kinase GRC3/NOL9